MCVCVVGLVGGDETKQYARSRFVSFYQQLLIRTNIFRKIIKIEKSVQRGVGG